MITIIFVILYLIIAGLTTFGCMYYDRVTYGSYDPDIAYFGIGIAWPILLPIFLVVWIYMQLKKVMILIIELLMVWRDKDEQGENNT